MGQFQIRAKICVSKRRTKILIKLKDRAILCVKSGEFMVFPTIAFTAVTTAAQSYVAAMAGADFVIPYFNRLERSGIDASERIAEMAALLHKQHLPIRILAASIKSPLEAVSALSAGAHDITAAPQVLLDIVSDPQTEEAIEKFAQDWQKMKQE